MAITQPTAQIQRNDETPSGRSWNILIELVARVPDGGVQPSNQASPSEAASRRRSKTLVEIALVVISSFSWGIISAPILPFLVDKFVNKSVPFVIYAGLVFANFANCCVGGAFEGRTIRGCLLLALGSTFSFLTGGGALIGVGIFVEIVLWRYFYFVLATLALTGAAIWIWKQVASTNVPISLWVVWLFVNIYMWLMVVLVYLGDNVTESTKLKKKLCED